MKLEGIKVLYKSMREQKIDRYKFDFTFSGKKIDVIYFVDEVPHKLAIGILSHNFYFELDVNIGYDVKPYIERYAEFCKVMGFKYNKESQFSPTTFFEHLNKSVPAVANKNNIPQPHEVAQFRRDVEESKKIYFVGWLDNSARGRKVSEENLKKTRRLLSEKACEMCKEKNVSSRWSDKPSDARNFKIEDLEKNF